jgi:Cys-rich protein (TIGR01571 family)
MQSVIFVFCQVIWGAAALSQTARESSQGLFVDQSSVSDVVPSEANGTAPSAPAYEVDSALDALESHLQPVLGTDGSVVNPSGQVRLATAVTGLLDFLPIAVLVLAVAFYRQKTKEVVVPDLRDNDGEKAETFETFHDTICNCCSDWNTCLWSFFCPCVRWAENQSAVGIVGFWAAVAIILVLCGVDAVSGVAAWITIALVQMLFRQLFRRAFKMEGTGTCCSFFKYFLAYCFCGPCTIAQEARHVEAAALAGHEAVSLV